MNAPGLTVAILPFGYVLEDYTDKLKIPVESFCAEISGGWGGGYVESLRRLGIRTVMICFSARVTKPTRFTNQPMAIDFWLLPSPVIYRAMKRRISNPYGRNLTQAFGDLRGARRMATPLLWMLKELAPYAATPMVALAKLLRRERCGAILCQEYEFACFDSSVLLGKRMGLPVFGVFQGGDYQRGRLERFIRPLTIRACAGLIAGPAKECERLANRYEIRAPKVTQIFNPIDGKLWQPVNRAEARRSLGIPARAKVAAWHGRVTISQKGLDVLLAAWTDLCRRRPGQDLRLLLVGTGRDADELRRLIAETKLAGIQWIDEFVLDRDRLRSCLSAADLYVFPSRHEGFPVAPIEAMACGLPVVAADANGVADIFEGGESAGGIIVSREDPLSFARAIERLLDDEPLRCELGERARTRAQTHFSFETVGQQLRDFLFAKATP